jgi:hypothetical protein
MAGNMGAVDPLHIGAIAVNVGVMFGFTVRFNVTILSQPVVEKVSFSPVCEAE